MRAEYVTPQSVLINGFGVLFVILNAFSLGLRLSVGKLLAQAFAHWKIAVCALVINLVIIPGQGRAIRHASETTTAARNIAPMLLMMIFPFRSDPLVTVSITILNTVGSVTALSFVLSGRRALHRRTLKRQPSSQQAKARPRRL